MKGPYTTVPPCPISKHAHDCDCYSKPDGSWHLDPACRPMNDSQREQILDRRIQQRLATDAAYRYAETADEQADCEDEIEREEEERLARETGTCRCGMWPVEEYGEICPSCDR